jgi:hypothetical protein
MAFGFSSAMRDAWGPQSLSKSASDFLPGGVRVVLSANEQKYLCAP